MPKKYVCKELVYDKDGNIHDFDDLFEKEQTAIDVVTDKVLEWAKDRDLDISKEEVVSALSKGDERKVIFEVNEEGKITTYEWSISLKETVYALIITYYDYNSKSQWASKSGEWKRDIRLFTSLKPIAAEMYKLHKEYRDKWEVFGNEADIVFKVVPPPFELTFKYREDDFDEEIIVEWEEIPID